MELPKAITITPECAASWRLQEHLPYTDDMAIRVHPYNADFQVYGYDPSRLRYSDFRFAISFERKDRDIKDGDVLIADNGITFVVHDSHMKFVRGTHFFLDDDGTHRIYNPFAEANIDKPSDELMPDLPDKVYVIHDGNDQDNTRLLVFSISAEPGKRGVFVTDSLRVAHSVAEGMNKEAASPDRWQIIETTPELPIMHVRIYDYHGLLYVDSSLKKRFISLEVPDESILQA